MSRLVKPFAVGLLAGGVVVASCIAYKVCQAPPVSPPATAAAAATAQEAPAETEADAPPAWLKLKPGERYAGKPKKIPQVLYEKYQSFDESFEAAKAGGGEFVQTDEHASYRVNHVDEGSDLYSRVGLRPGDKVISVNGQPVGQSSAAGKAMFDQLKNERRFSVLVEREGKQIVLSYTVGE